jgi:uncharacterized protein GlcG (DUF336 family)
VATPTQISTTVTFSGSQSAQAAAGETVTIVVTKPDGTTDTFTAATQADGTYSTSTTYAVAGSYSAVASAQADAQYTSWTSTPQAFTIPTTPPPPPVLTPRTGTLTVTVS